METDHKTIARSMLQGTHISHVLLYDVGVCYLYKVTKEKVKLLVQWGGSPVDGYTKAPYTLVGIRVRARVVSGGLVVAKTLLSQEAPPKRGRPCLVNPASMQVHLRLTPLEKADWEIKAKAAGKTLTAWIKGNCN